MKNFDVISDYYLGRDPQLKETCADNALRLIGIPGSQFVLRTELLALKEYLEGKDQDLADAIQGALELIDAEERARKAADLTLTNDLNAEETARINAVNTEKNQRQSADNALSGRITTIENWKNNSNFVYLSDLQTALTNYYTKSEVDSLIAAIPTLTYEVVQTLPTTNISTRTIYMVPNGTSTTPDFYDEYMYLGDTSQPYDPDNWELIGTTNIDLSNYYTKLEVDSKLSFTKLSANLILYDATPLTLTTGWYDTDQYVIQHENDLDPLANEHTLFYYNADWEGIFFVTPANVNATDTLSAFCWRDQFGNEWVFDGYFVTNTINDQSLVNEVPSAAATYRIIADAVDYVYNSWLDQIPTATATGETINVQDSSNLPLKDFALGGNASQFTTTGKNIIPNNATSTTINGITFTVNSDGTIKANGTATATTTLYMDNASKLIGQSGTYTISSGLNSASGVRFGISINGTYYNTSSSRTETFESITSQGQTYYQIDSGKSVSNLVLYPMIVQGSTAGDYEPYTGGKALPNPDYPQDIHVVTGDNTVKVVGKNLYKIGTTTDYTGSGTSTMTISNNTISHTIASGGSRYFINDVLKFGNNISVSAKYNEDSNTPRILVRAYDSSGTQITSSVSGWSYNSYYAAYVKASSTANFSLQSAAYTKVGFGFVGTVNNTGTYSQMQVEENTTTATEYEPYTEQTQLISLGNIELAKVGNYKDRIYKSGDTWYLEKNTASVTLDGSESIVKSGSTANDIFVVSSVLSNENQTAKASSISTHFGYLDSTATVGKFYITNEHKLAIVFTTYGTTTLEQFETWCSNNSPIFYYPISTPTTTEITDTTLITQLENILQMHTNKNVTNAWIEPSGTNAQASMGLVYRQDLATVIDQAGEVTGVIELNLTLSSSSTFDFTDYVGKYVRLNTSLSLPTNVQVIMNNQSATGNDIYYVASATKLNGSALYRNTSNFKVEQLSLVKTDNTWAFAEDGYIAMKFVGTNGSLPGTTGFVPAPTASDADKYLKSDGTWAAVPSSVSNIDSISVNSVAQTPDVNKNVDISVPEITYSTTDLTPGTSTLADGTFYFVYE